MNPLRQSLLDHALSLPEAWQDHPWGEPVAKVRKKVFVFLGRGEDGLGLSLKLPHSGPDLLTEPWAKPTGYGLGRSGWVSLTLEGHELSIDALKALIDESYCAVAPMTLARKLSL